jgi:hypothetical protein
VRDHGRPHRVDIGSYSFRLLRHPADLSIDGGLCRSIEGIGGNRNGSELCGVARIDSIRKKLAGSVGGARRGRVDRGPGNGFGAGLGDHGNAQAQIGPAVFLVDRRPRLGRLGRGVIYRFRRRKLGS